MKKNLFLLLMVAFISSFAIAADQEATNKTTVSAASDFSHWSLGAKAGVNYTDIYDTPMRRDDNWHPVMGAVLEYTINPIFGLGLEYEFNDYCSAVLHNGTQIISADAFGNTHDASIFGSFNLSNIIKPVREGFWKKTNIYANLGAGVGYYQYDYQSLAYPGTDNGYSPLAYIGLNAEHNISDSWAIGLESQYRYYASKELGGLYSQADINQLGTVTLGLRYKFGAKSKKHVRNVSVSEYNYVPAPVVEQPKPEVKVEVADVKPTPTPTPKPEPKPEVKPEPVINFSFDNIQFKFDSDQLTDEAIVIVDNLVNTLKNYKSWSKLQMNGHTDNVGTNVYNQDLSERRVATVKKYLVDKGIPEAKLSFKGFGEEQPKTTNDTKEGRYINRRVEFEVAK